MGKKFKKREKHNLVKLLQIDGKMYRKITTYLITHAKINKS